MTQRERRDPLDDIDDLLVGDEVEQPLESEPEPSEFDEPVVAPEEDLWIADDERAGSAVDEDLWDDVAEPASAWPEERDDGHVVPEVEEERAIVEDDWELFEDEARLLPVGYQVVGLREVVALPELGGVELVAVMNSSLGTSVLHAPYEVVDGCARLWMGDSCLALPLGPSGGVLVVTLCGRRLELVVTLSGTQAEEPLELGRDGLELGRYLVDVGRSFIHRRRGVVPWRM